MNDRAAAAGAGQAPAIYRATPPPQAAPVDPAEVRLPRPPGIFRRWLAAHPRAVDVSIVVCYLFGCALMALLDFAGGFTASGDQVPPAHMRWPLVLVTIVRTVAVALALLYRRRYPLAGLVVTVLALFGEQGAQGVATSVALCFLLYAVPVYRSMAAGWAGYGVALFGTVIAYLLPENGTGFESHTGPGGVLVAEGAAGSAFSWVEFLGTSVMTALWYLAIVMLGINLGNRRRYLDAIIDRAHQLARERDQLAQLAVAEERSRIAREMHDIVAHSVSVMIALSEGASRAVQNAPDAASDAMQRSAETGRTALAEMRRLLGALNDPAEASPDYVPQPGVDDLPELVRGFRDAGLDVVLELTGGTAGDRGQELAVYRIAQEGLTNALRYAGTGARVRVGVERLPDRTLVSVRDHGRVPGSSAPIAGLGSGRGLQGLAERVRVFGGTIRSGPADGGGWLLEAWLPVDAGARDRGAVQPAEPETPHAVAAPLPAHPHRREREER